jgi:hypothetical protein
VSYPPPSPTPASLATLPPSLQLSPPLGGCIRVGAKTGGDGSASGGSRQQPQQNTRYLTAMPPAAGRLPPPLRSVTSCLLELYHKCVENDGWARVLYNVHGGLEKLTLIRNIQPAPTVAAHPEQCKPGHQASDRRWTRDRRRREAWAARRLHRSQPCLHTTSIAEEESATAEPATARQAVSPVTTPPSTTVLLTSPQLAPPPLPLPLSSQPAPPPPPISQSPQPALPLLAPLPQPARHRHRVNVQKQSVRQPGLVTKPQCSQRRGRSHS